MTNRQALIAIRGILQETDFLQEDDLEQLLDSVDKMIAVLNKRVKNTQNYRAKKDAAAGPIREQILASVSDGPKTLNQILSAVPNVSRAKLINILTTMVEQKVVHKTTTVEDGKCRKAYILNK